MICRGDLINQIARIGSQIVAVKAQIIALRSKCGSKQIGKNTPANMRLQRDQDLANLNALEMLLPELEGTFAGLRFFEREQFSYELNHQLRLYEYRKSQVQILRGFLSVDNTADILKSCQDDNLSWVAGRQESGYVRAEVSNRFADLEARALKAIGAESTAHDCYLIRYEVGSFIPPHVDNAPFGSKHIRLNAIVASSGGGELKINGIPIQLNDGDAYIFRPDIEPHEVSTIISGTRLIFSVGVLV